MIPEHKVTLGIIGGFVMAALAFINSLLLFASAHEVIKALAFIVPAMSGSCLIAYVLISSPKDERKEVEQ